MTLNVRSHAMPSSCGGLKTLRSIRQRGIQCPPCSTQWKRPAGKREMKIVMASPDDAGKTTDLYRMMLDTAATAIPAADFQRRECGAQKPGAHCLGHWRTVIAYYGPDDKLRKATVPEGSRKSKAFEAVLYPLASMEERIEIPKAERHVMTIASTLREQDEMIVSSVSSVLLQGTATTRNSLTTIAAVSRGRTTLRREVVCRRCQRSRRPDDLSE